MWKPGKFISESCVADVHISSNREKPLSRRQSLLCATVALKQRYYLVQRPNVVGNASFHRGRDALFHFWSAISIQYRRLPQKSHDFVNRPFELTFSAQRWHTPPASYLLAIAKGSPSFTSN